MVAVLDVWAHIDTTFSYWKEFAPNDSPAPMSLLKRVLAPWVVEWMEILWQFLRTGANLPAQ